MGDGSNSDDEEDITITVNPFKIVKPKENIEEEPQQEEQGQTLQSLIFSSKPKKAEETPIIVEENPTKATIVEE